MKKLYFVAVVAAASACQFDTVVPEGTLLTCSADSDCPAGWACAEERCVNTAVNNLPSITIGTIPRSQGMVNIPVTIFDPERANVSLSLELVENGAATPIAVSDITLDGSSVTSTPGSGDGISYVVLWDAEAHFSNDTSYRSDLTIRITPTDDVEQGNAVESEPFSFGNDIPVITFFDLDLPEDEISNLVVVRLRVTDSASDPVSITELALAVDGVTYEALDIASLGSGGEFPSGALSGLATNDAIMAADEIEHSFVWNSKQSPQSNIDISGARMRVSVSDNISGTITSVPLDIGPFVINNANSAPVVAIETTVTSPVVNADILNIDYRITDLDGDFCDLVVEAWHPELTVPEWRPASSGTGNTTNIAPGQQQTFVWQVSADFPNAVTNDVYLRFTATDPQGAMGQDETTMFTIDNSGLTANQVPSIDFDTPAMRTAVEMDVPVTVADANGNNVDLTVAEVDYGSGWMTLTPVDPADLQNLSANNDGIEHIVRWNAPLDLSNDTTYRQVRFRFQGDDGTDTGNLATSAYYGYGNTAPVLNAVTVDYMSPEKLSGNIIVRVQIWDNAGDAVNISSIRLNDDVTMPIDMGAGANFPSGALTALPTNDTGPGDWYSFVWDSSVSYGMLSQDSSVLRVTITDDVSIPGLPDGLDSTEETSNTFDLQNDNQPPTITIEPFNEMTDFNPTTGEVNLSVTISDAEGAGLSLSGQYTAARSMGSPVMGTASTASMTTGLENGTHPFVWNASQLLPVEWDQGVCVTLSVSDGTNPPQSDVTTPCFNLDLSGLNSAPFVVIDRTYPPSSQMTSRPVDLMEFDFRVFDGNGNNVDVECEITNDILGGVWNTCGLTGTIPMGLAADSDGEGYPSGSLGGGVQWDLLTIPDQASYRNVDMGFTSMTVTKTYAIRIVPTDELGKEGVGAEEVVSIGNTNPKYRFRGLLPPNQSSGEMTVLADMRDEDEDPVRMALYYRALPSMVWMPAFAVNEPIGSTYPSSMQDVSYVFRWDSCVDLGSSFNGDVELQLRVSDNPSWPSTYQTMGENLDNGIAEYATAGPYTINNTVPMACPMM